jgi:hypothetical protein
VPSGTFEAALPEPDKLTTNALLSKATRPPSMPAHVLWLWGRMRDLKRDGRWALLRLSKDKFGRPWNARAAPTVLPAVGAGPLRGNAPRRLRLIQAG